MEYETLRLKKIYKLRKEWFGGLLFNYDTGRIEDLNKPAFSILRSICLRKDIFRELSAIYPDVSHEKLKNDIKTFVDNMLKRGIIVCDSEKEGVLIENEEISNNTLSAPRSIFWECTDKCNMAACIHCYSYKRFTLEACSGYEDDKLLAHEERLLNDAINMGVFTIDIGGGEPLTNHRLSTFINRANQKKIRCILRQICILTQVI